MSGSRVFCLRVEPLFAEKDGEHTWRNLYPRPSLCLCDFGPELINTILQLRELLLENDLAVLSQKTVAVKWFHKTTHRFHLDTPAFINVTASSVYFSGWHPPFKEPQFQTTKLSLSEISNTVQEYKRADLAGLHQPIDQGLIQQIVSMEEEVNRLETSISVLEELECSLQKVDDSAVALIETDIVLLTSSLTKELFDKRALVEQCQQLIERLSTQLLRRCLGIELGDWVVCDGSDYSRKEIQLQVEGVYYYDNKLCLNGPNITKQGIVGKRTESIYISIRPADEYSE